MVLLLSLVVNLQEEKVFDFLWTTLTREGAIDWARPVVDARVDRIFARYRETNRLLGGTGAGVTPEDLKKNGIMTIGDKREAMCPFYAKIDSLHNGGRQNTQPYQLLFHGAQRSQPAPPVQPTGQASSSTALPSFSTTFAPFQAGPSVSFAGSTASTAAYPPPPPQGTTTGTASYEAQHRAVFGA